MFVPAAPDRRIIDLPRLELDRQRQSSGGVHGEDISEDVAGRPVVTEQRRTRYASRNMQVRTSGLPHYTAAGWDGERKGDHYLALAA